LEIAELMISSSYVLVPSPFGTLALLWQDAPEGPRVCRILLPEDGKPTETMLQALHAEARPGSCLAMANLGKRIAGFLEGQDIVFPLDILALETCPEFQQRVLRAEHAIPRGWVSTYGRIAAHLGVPGAARAVGNALANNPFPILIPCHRAIRSDGTLGGYQGGFRMKQALLTLEGVEVSPLGSVLTDRVYY
jgi:methylated-DNA-[protein]-cysteine S-methyltransferase